MTRWDRFAVGFCLLAGVLVGVGCSSAPRVPMVIPYDSTRVDMEQHYPNEWTVQIRKAVDHGRVQESETLCWAACVQMVDSILNNPPKEQSQLKELHTIEWPWDKGDDTAESREIMDALAPGFRTQLNGRFVVDMRNTRGNPGLDDDDEIIRALSNGTPVIVGLTGVDGIESGGHAFVLYGVRYREHPDAAGFFKRSWNSVERAFSSDPTTGRAYELVEVMLWDPWPDSGETVMAGKTFNRGRYFAYTGEWAREQWKRELQWVNTYNEGPGVYIVNPIWGFAGEPLETLTVGSEFEK